MGVSFLTERHRFLFGVLAVTSKRRAGSANCPAGGGVGGEDAMQADRSVAVAVDCGSPTAVNRRSAPAIEVRGLYPSSCFARASASLAAAFMSSAATLSTARSTIASARSSALRISITPGSETRARIPE